MRALFISDLHLSERDSLTNARFTAFMQDVAPSAERIYIIGDLFNLWLGDELLAVDTFLSSTADRIALLNKGKREIFFIHGNRDFLIGAEFAKRAKFEILSEEAAIELDGKRCLLLHGDELCTDDRAYQRARRILRSAAFKRLASWLPFWLRRRIAARLRRASNAHQAHAPKQILDANPDAIRTMFEKHGVDLMIHGHTHRPTDELITTPSGAKRRIVLSDWQQDYGYLSYEQGEFRVHPWPSNR